MALSTREPHHWTAVETMAALQQRHVSAEELLDHYTARQAALDVDIGAVVACNVDAARGVARAIDQARSQGQPLGPLAGLPMTVKDTFETTDLPATAGLPALRHHMAAQDADAVARLRAAGAVIYGKTNVPVMAADHQSYNPVYGLTRNPWSLHHTVGGSSGGAAAALAAGFTALELGSDIGGSIRIPAHFCGVYGHKSSYGIISPRGHVPPAPADAAPSPLSVAGPMARSAADLALGLATLVGPAAAEAQAWQVQLPAARHARLRDFRVGLWWDAYAADQRYVDALQRFADALAREGAQVRALPHPPVDPLAAWDCYVGLLMGTIGSRMDPDTVDALRTATQDAPPGTIAHDLHHAIDPPLRRWVAQTQRQVTLRKQWARTFESVDVVLCPVAAGPAFEHQADDGHGLLVQLQRTLHFNGTAHPYMHNLKWAGLATLGHLPVTVRPLPERIDGLPVGVQIIGPYLEDLTPIQFAAHCDEVFGGFVPPGH